ncbi:hypothetical protein ACJJTC_010855 [Scirpophaga incertulas]
MQDVINFILRENLEIENLKEVIKTSILLLVDFDVLNCQEHNEQLTTYLVNIVSRCLIFNYCKDINKILSGRRLVDEEDDKILIKAKKYHDSPLPAGAIFTQEQLSILNEIDLEDSDILLQNLPLNSSIFPNDIPEFSPDPSSKHFTGEHNKTETLIYIESSSPSVIEDSRPGTPNTTFFYENKYNFDSIDNEKPSTQGGDSSIRLCHFTLKQAPSPLLNFKLLV